MTNDSKERFLAERVRALATVILTGGSPKLVHHTKPNCVELTDALLEQVVEQVVVWYDAVETMLIA